MHGLMFRDTPKPVSVDELIQREVEDPDCFEVFKGWEVEQARVASKCEKGEF